MKFIYDNATQIYASTGQTGIIARAIHRGYQGVLLMLIVLVIALAACSRPQQGSSGTVSGARGTGTQGTPTPSGYAGGAVLNLERNASFHSNQDIQEETGTVQLKFSETEEGDLFVKGTGKTIWTEVSTINNCSFKVKTETTVTVDGIYYLGSCTFDFRIDVKFPPSAATYDNSGVCDSTIFFNNSESSERIILSKPYSRTKNIEGASASGKWWQSSTVTMTDIKSATVTNCIAFLTPEVLPRKRR